MKTIYVFLAEGFEEVEALTPVDVLRRAGLPVKTVSVTGVLTVNGAHGVPVVADMVFEEVKEADTEMIVYCLVVCPERQIWMLTKVWAS